MSTYPKGPYTLVTVNNAPERAQRLVGRVVEIVKDRYIIKHVANAESMFPVSCSLNDDPVSSDASISVVNIFDFVLVYWNTKRRCTLLTTFNRPRSSFRDTRAISSRRRSKFAQLRER